MDMLRGGLIGQGEEGIDWVRRNVRRVEVFPRCAETFAWELFRGAPKRPRCADTSAVRRNVHGAPKRPPRRGFSAVRRNVRRPSETSAAARRPICLE